MSLAERLKEARKRAGKSQAQVAESAGMAQPSYHQLEKGKSQKSAYLPQIAQCLGVSTEWLLNGTESQNNLHNTQPDTVNQTNTPSFPFPFHYVEEWDDDTPLGNDEVEIVFFKDFHLSAGHGSFDEAVLENEKRRLRMGKNTLKSMGIIARTCYAFTVDGDSMYPEIRDGATVFVDSTRKQIKDGKIYAINHGVAFKVKRLYNLPLGGIRIVSDNEDKITYPTEELTAEQIVQDHFEIIGWVWQISQLERW